MRKQFSYKKELIVAFIFSVLSFLIILIWFKEGLIYGGGDVGIPTYNPARILGMTKYPWWEAVAPGFLIASSISSLPFEFILSLLQYFGLSNLLLQAFTFFLLFALMGIGMYLFLLTLFKGKHVLSLLGALFYMFNSYMLIQIWHRFVHTSIFFVALLPFMVIFWRRWIETGKVKDLFIFFLLNLFGSQIYGTLAFVVTIWLLLGGITILESTIPFKSRRLFLLHLSRLFIAFIGWILTNCWWLIPTFLIGSGQYAQQYNESSNLMSLIEISKQAILPFSLQMINPFNLYQQLDFGKIYLTLLFKLLPWLSVAVVFVGLLSSLKEKRFSFIGILTLLLLFLAKGTSAPLGNLFVWGFKSSFFLGVIRNPSEKIGILLPFVYAILFILGFLAIEKVLIKYKLKQISGISLAFLLILPNLIFCWPIFTGRVFATISNQATVSIPDAYKQVDDFIKNQNFAKSFQDTGRILHLPLTVSDALTYNWESKYRGVDPNVLLFDSMPSISRSLNLPKFEDSLKGLSFIFMYPYSQDESAILKALQYFNVKIIILHKDADHLTDGVVDPKELEKLLDSLPFLKRINTSGELMVYKIEDRYFEPKIVFSENPSYIRGGENNNVWLFQTGDSRSSISDSPENQANSNIYKSLPISTIFADKSLRFYQASSSAVLSSIFYNNLVNKLNISLQRAKYNQNSTAANAINELLLLTQILGTYTNQGIIKKSETVSNLKSLLEELFQDQQAFVSLQNYLDRETLQLVFQEQLLLLNQIGSIFDDHTNDFGELSNKIIQALTKNNVFPMNYYKGESNIGVDRQVFNLSLPRSSNYKIYLTKVSDPSIFENDLSQLPFMIDGKKQVLESMDEGNTLSFGVQNFEEGIHEISYPTLFSENLLVDREEWKISQGRLGNSEILLETVGNTYGVLVVPIKEIERRGGGAYRINMEIMVQSGQGFYIQLLQNSDPIDQSGQPGMLLNQGFSKEEIGEGWKNINFDINLRMTTKNANLRFILVPDDSFLGIKSSLSIKNLSFQKILDSAIFLRTNDVGLEVRGQVTKIIHPNPIFYSGEINIAKPSFLILKETYNPGWKLKINNNTVQPKDHLIGDLYGNAWFVEKPGKYSFEIKFEPIKYNVIGFWVSTITFFGIIIVITLEGIRKRRYE